MVIVQIVYGEVPSRLALGPDLVRKAFPDTAYELVRRDPIADPIKRCVESDKLRFALAREYGPQMCYLDLDVQVLKPWKFLPGPHCAYRRGEPACFAFYGLATRLLDEIDAEREKRGISLDTYCWPAKVLRGRGDLYEIPTDCYIHHAYTRSGFSST